MSQPEQWKRGLRPDADVVALAEQILHAAQLGTIRALAVVTLNPALAIETADAGAGDGVRQRLLLCGLIEASRKIQPIK